MYKAMQARAAAAWAARDAAGKALAEADRLAREAAEEASAVARLLGLTATEHDHVAGGLVSWVAHVAYAGAMPDTPEAGEVRQASFTPTPIAKASLPHGIEDALNGLQDKLDGAFKQVADGANLDLLGDAMDEASKDLVSLSKGDGDKLDEWVAKMFTMNEGHKRHDNPVPAKAFGGRRMSQYTWQ